MEKTISQEDRIRRAEEIYYRRNNLRSARTTINPKKEYRLLKKIAIQILICIGIYFVIYWMQANTDNFSIDGVEYIKSTLGYDVNIEGLISEAKNYMGTWMTLEEKKDETGGQEDLPEETLAVAEDTEGKSEDVEEADVVEETSSVNQMEEDAEYIKTNFSLIKPVTGTITSRFGLRNPTTATVPKYHTGIDIAVPEGTIYVAAMDGTVELVSSEGDYRESYKNYECRCNNPLCTL